MGVRYIVGLYVFLKQNLSFSITVRNASKFNYLHSVCVCLASWVNIRKVLSGVCMLTFTLISYDYSVMYGLYITKITLQIKGEFSCMTLEQKSIM